MKLSVSLPDDDVVFLDLYAERKGHLSRSAALQHAVRLLRMADLATDYEEAYREWEASGDAALWDRVAGDGLGRDAAR
ncbi:MAG: ribbon-helix-helix domain-containing protein [Chloroflexota bacterium]